MPQRDPVTGQYVSGDASQYSDYEFITFQETLRVPASDLDGQTTGNLGDEAEFEGHLVYDMSDFLDRHEVGRLLKAAHRMVVGITSTQTADGTVRGAVELSSSPSIKVTKRSEGGGGEQIADVDGNMNVWQGSRQSDTFDLVGRPLDAIGYGPFSDGASGVGGAGTSGEDETDVRPIDWEMDTRDDMFLNGVIEASNVADSSIVMEVTGQHVYGIHED